MSTPLKTTIPDHNSSDLPRPWPSLAPGCPLVCPWSLLGVDCLQAPGSPVHGPKREKSMAIQKTFIEINGNYRFPWTIDFIDFEFSRLELVFKNGKVHFFTDSRSHQNHLRKQQTKHPWLGSGRPKSSIRRQTRPRDMLKPKDLQWGWHISSGCC